MATAYSDIGTIQNTGNLANRVQGGKLTGKILYAVAAIVSTGRAAADVFNLVKLPAGAIVVPALCKVETEDWGTDVSITIGDDDAGGTPASDADRYSTAISLATAGTISFVSGIAGVTPAALTQESWITGTLVDAGTISVTTAKNATVLIAYRFN